MLSAQSTRDLNQAARTASRFLAELGFTLPHAKALDLVARLVGKPHHMAAQAGLPSSGLARPLQVKTWGDLQAALSALTPEQLAMSLTVSEGCDSNGNAEFYPAGTFLRAGDHSLLAASDGVLEAEQPVLLFEGSFAGDEAAATLVPGAVVEDLCRLLAHPDLDEALHREGISDAAYSALAAASPYVSDEVLVEFSPDVLRDAYDSLPVTASPLEFMQGHGNWSLTPDELAQARRLAELLVPSGTETEDVKRLMAQFEMATGKSPWFIPQLVRKHGAEAAVRRINADHSLGLSLGPFVLASDKARGFWCNGFGWASSRLAATGYEYARQLPGSWPSDVRFQLYSDVQDYEDTDRGG